MTKYARQIASARKTITKKGTTVTWFKADNTDSTDDDAPEFPTEDTAKSYVVPIVFYPANSAALVTSAGAVKIGAFSDRLQGIIPGDVPFTPIMDDAVQLPDGSITHVDTVNVLQPDFTPILYEIVFK